MSSKVPIAIVLAGVVVAGAVYFAFSTPETSRITIRPVTPSDHLFGNPSAPLVLVTYLDPSQDESRVYANTLYHFVSSVGAGGKAAWVYRAFPASGETAALTESRALECASLTSGENAFWKLEEARSLDATVPLGKLATSLNLDQTFATCTTLAPDSVDTRILRDRQEALDLGAEVPPLTVVLREGAPPALLVGPASFDDLRALVK